RVAMVIRASAWIGSPRLRSARWPIPDYASQPFLNHVGDRGEAPAAIVPKLRRFGAWGPRWRWPCRRVETQAGESGRALRTAAIFGRLRAIRSAGQPRS